jgi:hypothetical protein
MIPIRPEFKAYKLNAQGIMAIEELRAKFSILLDYLEYFCSASTREFSIAKTKLEEALFFANKAISLNPENQEIK